MNPSGIKAWVDQLLFSVSQAIGITVPRVLGLALGAGVLILLVMRVWERKLKIAPAILFGIPALGLVVISVDTSFLHEMFTTSSLDRIRFVFGVLSVTVIAVTFESIRISKLRERFALLWLGTGFVVLGVALWPELINFLSEFLGLDYVECVVLVIFVFLLLVTFHFSITLSRLESDKAQIAQHSSLLELRIRELEKQSGIAPPSAPEKPEVSRPKKEESRERSLPGVFVTSMTVIAVAFLFVLIVGLVTERPLVGDEVTHFYLLDGQAKNLGTFDLFAEIPNEWGGIPEIRGYPHPNGWHYLGAVFYKLFLGNSIGVQLYHSIFWLQFMVIAYFWSSYRRGTQSRSSLLYLLVLVSIPMNILFSVTFYQDIPMIAQVLTAFYLLDRRKVWLSGVFIALSLWMKSTAILFVPPYLIVAFFHLVLPEILNRERAYKTKAKVVLKLVYLLAMVMTMMIVNQKVISGFARTHDYYPVVMLKRMNLWPEKKVPPVKVPKQATGEIRTGDSEDQTAPMEVKKEKKKNPIVANHPGDLRHFKNYVIYGGGLLWMVLFAGLVGVFRPRSHKIDDSGSRKHAWPFFVGLFYISAVAYFLRGTPDARFFLPGLPFVLMPVCEWAMRVPKNKVLILGAVLISILQAGYVGSKILQLRSIPDDLTEGIDFLREHPPTPPKILMYPEGNYRLFPVEHDWYMNYALPHVWTGNNDVRIDFFQRHRIGAVVVKKHLIHPVKDPTKDLGYYPPSFVQDLNQDPRFEKVFSNSYMSIYSVPPLVKEESE